MLVIWKLRLRPLRLISNGLSPVMSSPLSSIRPCVTGNRALTRLNSVDFPAPVGPMMACRSPASTSRLTSLMIDVRPKLWHTPDRRNAAVLMGPLPRDQLEMDVLPLRAHDTCRVLQQD